MSSNINTTPAAVTYVALYEDSAKVEAAATAAGCPKDGSFLDYVEASEHRTAKRFVKMESAVEWLVAEIKAGKSLFGVGEVVTQEEVTKRCKYCTCGGRITTHRTIVDDEGATEPEALDNDCLN